MRNAGHRDERQPNDSKPEKSWEGWGDEKLKTNPAMAAGMA